MSAEQGTALRLYDPARDPVHWDAIIRPGEVAVFATNTKIDTPCDMSALPFPSPAQATCQVFTDLAAAHAACEEASRRSPDIFFEIFDSSGKAKPPLMTLGRHPDGSSLFANPRFAPWRRFIAGIMVPTALWLFWFDYQRQGLLVFPTAIGLNLLVLGIRLMLLDVGVNEAARAANERLAAYRRRE